MEEGRGRIMRLSIGVALLLIGAAVGGVYIFRAATAQEQPAASEPQAAGDSAATDAGATSSKVAAAGDDEAGEDGTPIPVGVAEPVVGSISTYISATANLVPDAEVRVLAEAEGRLTRLLVEEGDTVGAGTLLAELDPAEAEMALNKARLTEDNTRMAFERASRMYAENLIAQEEFDKITMDHRIAQQVLAEARWRQERTRIHAPIDGRITRRDCTPGQHIRPADALFTVTDFSPLIARIYLPEKDVLGLVEGQDVRISLKADETARFRGRIRQISPVVDTATGTVKLTIAALDPPTGVRPGGFVAVDITRVTHDNALLLPKQAVIRELQKAHVFLAAEGLAHKREVTLGLEEGENVEIVSGIARGEQVVVAGQGSLEEGSKIKVLAPEAEAQASTEKTTERPDRS